MISERRVLVTFHAVERLAERAGEAMTRDEVARAVSVSIAAGRLSRRPPSWVRETGPRLYAWPSDESCLYVLREQGGGLLLTTVLTRPLGFIKGGLHHV